MQLDAEHLITVLAEKIGTLPPETAIVGIHSGGVWVAERLRPLLDDSNHPHRAYGTLAVTLHRDDFSAIGLHPQKKSTDIDFTVEGRDILLVDDVINSGRTIRAALNELFDFGRPARVRLACLVDRGGRALPFSPDYVALTMDLPTDEELALAEDTATGKLRFDIYSKLHAQS